MKINKSFLLIGLFYILIFSQAVFSKSGEINLKVTIENNTWIPADTSVTIYALSCTHYNCNPTLKVFSGSKLLPGTYNYSYKYKLASQNPAILVDLSSSSNVVGCYECSGWFFPDKIKRVKNTTCPTAPTCVFHKVKSGSYTLKVGIPKR